MLSSSISDKDYEEFLYVDDFFLKLLYIGVVDLFMSLSKSLLEIRVVFYKTFYSYWWFIDLYFSFYFGFIFVNKWFIFYYEIGSKSKISLLLVFDFILDYKLMGVIF